MPRNYFFEQKLCYFNADLVHNETDNDLHGNLLLKKPHPSYPSDDT